MPPGDADRLRAALRLLFESEEADRVAALAAGARSRDEALRRVARSSLLRRGLARWRGALVRRRDSAPGCPPLGAQAALPARAALALALHLGLDLDDAKLSRALGLDPEEVGLALDRARQAIRPGLPPACKEYAALAARYRDRALEPRERLVLLRHGQECARCRDALQARRQVDEGLVASIDAFQAALPPGPCRPSRVERWLTSPAALLLGLSALLVALLAAGGIAWDSLGSERRAPVPLAGTTTPVVEGWLLMRSGDFGLVALDLATGRQRTVLEASPSAYWSHYRISPDRQLVARWDADRTGLRISVFRLDGSLVRTWLWQDEGRVHYLFGWLDRSTLLVGAAPAPSEDAPGTQCATGGRGDLFSLDVYTGRQRVLSRRAIYEAHPSPDGSLLAIVHSSPDTWPGSTVILCPVEPGGLGLPLAVVRHRVWGHPVWAPDSSRLYLGWVSDRELRPPPPASPVPVEPSDLPQQVEIVALDRQGRLQTIVPAEPGNWLLPLAVSPDGQTLIYLAVAEDPFGEPVRSVWRVGADGGKARQLATLGRHLESVQFTWTGDGSLLLAEELSLFIQGERAGGEDAFPWVALTVTRPDGSRAPVMVMPGSFTGFVEALSWLPPGAFQDPATVAVLQGAVSVPSPVTGLPSGLRLSAGSSVSADGERVLLVDDRMGQGVVVWHRTAEVGRALGQRIGDPSWVPGQPVLAGVLRNAPGQWAGSSAGIVFGVESIRSWTSYDLRVFDPIEIEGQPHRRYARPLVAPGGLAVAFFTVDDQAGTVELWIATADGRTRRVPIESDWPAGSPLGEARPVALWLDRGTLLYAAPEDWEAGLPRRVTLWCVAVTADGQLAAEPAMTIDARGREAGIHLRELALSPDGTRLAYRLRHYTRSDPASGAFDTLVVVPVADASRQLEIARGKPGDGLDWSPDSRWLVAGLRGRVELLSADGRQRAPLSPEGVTASYPVWVDPHTVWYQQVDGDEEVVMAVEVW